MTYSVLDCRVAPLDYKIAIKRAISSGNPKWAALSNGLSAFEVDRVFGHTGVASWTWSRSTDEINKAVDEYLRAFTNLFINVPRRAGYTTQIVLEVDLKPTAEFGVSAQATVREGDYPVDVIEGLTVRLQKAVQREMQEVMREGLKQVCTKDGVALPLRQRIVAGLADEIGFAGPRC